MTDAAVAAFARGCRGLRRLCLRGVVGVPPPLGAPGILAVCCYCRELELLDLGEVWGLEDSALVGFHDHQMGKLEKVSEMELVLPNHNCSYVKSDQKDTCQETPIISGKLSCPSTMRGLYEPEASSLKSNAVSYTHLTLPTICSV